MNIIRFLTHVAYVGDKHRPEGVSVPRWQAMVKWLALRDSEGHSRTSLAAVHER